MEVKRVYLRALSLEIQSVDELYYQLIRLLEAKPALSQREIAGEMGISLGKANYCLQALVKKGWIRATNFRVGQSKVVYMYLLTPRGIRQKESYTVRFLKLKIEEREALRAEIKLLRREVQRNGRFLR